MWTFRYEDTFRMVGNGKTYVNNSVASLLAQSNNIANLWNFEEVGIIDFRERQNPEELEQPGHCII